jgi:hypothetical protein
VESFTPEPPFVPNTGFSTTSFAPEVDFSADPYSSETAISPESVFPVDIFQPQPEAQPFNRIVPSPQPLQLFNHVAPAVEHPVVHQSVNEIVGSSQAISNIEESYDYEPDYESLQVGSQILFQQTISRYIKDNTFVNRTLIGI